LEYSVQQDAASLQTVFAVVTWAKKVHRLLVIQDFLTGSTWTGDNATTNIHNSTVEHLRCQLE